MSDITTVSPIDESIRGGILSINIDANSRAPLRCYSLSQDIENPFTQEDDPTSCSGTSSPSSRISFCSEVEPEPPLVRCGDRGDAYLRDIAEERKIRAETERSPVDKLGSELIRRLSKVRQVITRESDERRETRHLLKRCRRDILANRVQAADEMDRKRRRSSRAPSSPGSVSSGIAEFHTPFTSNSPRPTYARLPILSYNASPVSSRNNSTSTSVFSAPSPRKRSSASTLDSDTDAAIQTLRQRRISRPVEYDSKFHPRQLEPLAETERCDSVSSDTPIFQTPRWTPPTADNCMACEIVRTITNQEGTRDDGIDSISPTTKTFRRISLSNGNDMIEQIQNTDEDRRKKVLLEWGVGVDEIIPRSTDDLHEVEVSTGRHLKSRMSSRFRALCAKARVPRRELEMV